MSYNYAPLMSNILCNLHHGHMVARSNQILGVIKCTFVYKDTDVIKKLFTALV